MNVYVALCYYIIGLSSAEHIHLSFSNYASNYYFCGEDVLCSAKITDQNYHFAKTKGTLAFSFIIVFFQRVENLFQRPDITLSKM